jgi:prefoldin subunit 5
MPLNGFKSVTVPEEAYCEAKQLISLGLEKSIGKAFENAIKEYSEKRQGLIKELKTVKEKWNKKIDV